MILILEITIAVLGVIGILAYLGDKLSKNASSKANELVRELEEHYLTFVEKQKTLLLMEHNEKNASEPNDAVLGLTNEQIQQFIDEVFEIVKPDIDALLGHINATKLSDVKIQSQSRFFRNVAHIAESLFEKRKTEGQTLSERDEEKMYSAVKDAIRADLKERLVNWRLESL